MLPGEGAEPLGIWPARGAGARTGPRQPDSARNRGGSKPTSRSRTVGARRGEGGGDLIRLPGRAVPGEEEGDDESQVVDAGKEWGGGKRVRTAGVEN